MRGNIIVFLLLLVLECSTVSANSDICHGPTIVNPPNDLTKPFYWPAGWNENLKPPSHIINQQCSFWFNVPKGLYARLVLKGKVTSDHGDIIVKDTIYNEHLSNPNLDPFFFVYSGFNVTLIGREGMTMGTLGFKVVWSNFPSVTPSKVMITNGTIHAHPAADAQHGLISVTESGSKVSLLPVPKTLVYQKQDSLRNTLIFDGPTYYSNYAGNLRELWNRQNQFVSTGNSLTVFTFEPGNSENMFVIQDYRDTMGFDRYNAVATDNSGKYRTFFDSTLGKSAAISISDGGETLTGGEFNNDGTLSVYSGVISKSNLMNTYNSKTIQTNLPYKYNVNIRQYVCEKCGVGSATVSR